MRMVLERITVSIRYPCTPNRCPDFTSSVGAGDSKPASALCHFDLGSSAPPSNMGTNQHPKSGTHEGRSSELSPSLSERGSRTPSSARPTSATSRPAASMYTSRTALV
ncbi:hypothetical protein PG989_006401 [Apiospora arundinis]